MKVIVPLSLPLPTTRKKAIIITDLLALFTEGSSLGMIISNRDLKILTDTPMALSLFNNPLEI
jgi:hypothetical protein